MSLTATIHPLRQNQEQKTSLYDWDLVTLREFLQERGCPACAAEKIFDILYKKKWGIALHDSDSDSDFDSVSDLEKVSLEKMSEGHLSKHTYRILEENFTWQFPRITHTQESEDETVKFLIEFPDGKSVETVLVPFGNRYTVCLSTQVGCAMNCSFCYTGTQGLKRHLRPGEIVAQYLLAWHWLEKKRAHKSVVPKIVFMGQGEPLHNFEHVKKALQIFLAEEGIHLVPRQMTLSTAGYLPGLLKFTELYQINLAISLHSAFDEIRSQLIPLNRTYPLSILFETLKTIPLKRRQFINFEYLLIDGLNDRDEDITQLLDVLREQKAIVNIIPFNEFPGSPYKRPSNEKVVEFRKKLSHDGLYVTVRTTKGSDILAACGQLKVEAETRIKSLEMRNEK